MKTEIKKRCPRCRKSVVLWYVHQHCPKCRKRWGRLKHRFGPVRGTGRRVISVVTAEPPTDTIPWVAPKVEPQAKPQREPWFKGFGKKVSKAVKRFFGPEQKQHRKSGAGDR